MRWPAPLAASVLLLASAAHPLPAQAQSDDTIPDVGDAELAPHPDYDFSVDEQGDALVTQFETVDTPKPTAPASSVVLPDGDPYWGAVIPGAPWNTSAIDAFESKTHKKLSILSFGMPWKNSAGTYQPFFSASVMNIPRNRGIIPMLTWGSDQSGKSVNQSAFQLNDISSGAYDSYIRSWATAAKAWGHPFFLRFDWEMNGNWYPWSERANGNSAGQYVTMWRHVHNIFTSVGATNVVWVWCPNIVGSTSTPLSELYPGDAYVDWTCLDGYNWAGVKNVPWQTITQVFRGGRVTSHDSYAEIVKVAPTKPVMIGETGSSEKGGSKADWLKSALATELPQNMPQVKALVYFNTAADGADWPIETSSSATSGFATGVQNPYWEPNNFATISSIDTLMEGQAVSQATVAGSGAGNATINPSVDTFADQGTLSTNYGGSSELHASDGSQIAYLQFDLSSLAGHTITGANLELHTTTESWAGSASKFTVVLVQSGWQEGSLTWSNHPALSSTVVGSVNAPATPNAWYSIGLSLSTVQSAAGSVLNVALEGSTTDTWSFNSSESSLSPKLTVSFQ